MTLTPRPHRLYAIGDKVFDMPTQQVQTVTSVEVQEVLLEGVWADYADTDADGDEAFMVIYGVTGPSDPTGDGTFGTTRLLFEVCDPDKTLPLNY